MFIRHFLLFTSTKGFFNIDLQIEAGLPKVKFEAWVEPTSGRCLATGSQVFAYEAGWKGALLNRNINGSMSVFYNNYDNFQNSNINDTTDRSDVSNIADPKFIYCLDR